MYKKSRKMVLMMLGIALFMVCGLTVAHVFTSSQNINTGQTSGGWGGDVYGSYDGYTHQLTLTPQITPGPSGSMPAANLMYWFEIFNNGTPLPMSTYLGSTPAIVDGTVPSFSTNLLGFGDIPSGNISINVAFGGTSYTSRFNYFDQTIFLSVTGNDKPDLNTSILGENITVNSGDSLDYKVRLVDSNGNPVTGAPVTLTANGEDHTVTTDVDGYASYEFTNIKEDMTVTAAFNGVEGANVYYLSSTGSFMITVNPAPNPDNNGTGGNGGGDWFDSFCDGLPWTGIPLLVLVFAIVGGVYYYKKK
ncbi:MAG: Ig-like domain-containing protein [Methanobrevibacter sp.]|nr:Ig-like domain-containing protein [Candidatus Methanovirga australis]